MEFNFWDKEIETLPREEIEKLQLEALKKQIDNAFKTDFYKKKLTEAGITSSDDIKSLKDLKKIPFTTKHDLREVYPYGLLAVPQSEVVRVHASSGTTGTPTVIYLTQKDVDVAADTMARCLASAGCTKEDTCQNVLEILNECEMTLYTPQIDNKTVDAIYQKTITAINDIEAVKIKYSKK